LKNAIDHLYREWRGKPAMIVSYGSHGGGKCAAQLQQVADCLKMRVAPTMPALQLSDDMMRNGDVSPDRDFARHLGMVEQAWDELELLQSARMEAPVRCAQASRQSLVSTALVCTGCNGVAISPVSGSITA
jgi:NAD(P)H-dependent FMN reductase